MLTQTPEPSTSGKPYCCLAIHRIPDLNFVSLASGGTQTLPISRLNKDGARFDNITDWALKQFQTHYGKAPASPHAGDLRSPEEPRSGVSKDGGEQIRVGTKRRAAKQTGAPSSVETRASLAPQDEGLLGDRVTRVMPGLAPGIHAFDVMPKS